MRALGLEVEIIPFRQLKDPREIKMLDPACGSMHFGLYAFDLFEQIYSEAWELKKNWVQDAFWRLADLNPLHQSYPDKETFIRDIPRLIIERNIHGIDIDPRACKFLALLMATCPKELASARFETAGTVTDQKIKYCLCRAYAWR